MANPGLIAVGGLPGTGKSVVSREIGELLDARVLRTDEIRKELFLEPSYRTEEFWRTYAVLFHRAAGILAQRQPVVLDATFRHRELRQRAIDVAVAAGVPWYFVLVTAEEELVRQRIGLRTGDASDADFLVHLRMREQFQPWTEIEADRIALIDNARGFSHLDIKIDALARRWNWDILPRPNQC